MSAKPWPMHRWNEWSGRTRNLACRLPDLCILISSSDEGLKRLFGWRQARGNFDMSHEASGTLQQAGRVLYDAAKEEADVDVGPKCIDVTKCEVPDARGGVAIMEHLQNVRPTRAHLLEPFLSKGAQIARPLSKPTPDLGIIPYRPAEREQSCVGHVCDESSCAA